MRAMKDSGVEWVQRIPSEWVTKRLKYIAECNTDVLSENTDEDKQIKYIDIGSVTYEKGIEQIQEFRFSDSPSRARRVIKAGDTIISTVRTYLKAIAYIDQMYDGNICSTGFAVLRAKTECNPKFLYYALSAEWFISMVEANSTGISYPAITSTALSNLPAIMPKSIEQQRIVNFLDAKCAQIDAIIEKQQQVIEKLKEYKQSVITEAVTKGLDPTVPLKDSGVEWVGYIPESWDVLPLKKLCHLITDGTHQTPEYLPDGIPFISIKDISKGYLDFSDTKFISEEKHAELSKHAPIERGDILFTRIGTLGVSVVVDTDLPFDIFVSLGLIKNNKNIADAKWITYNMISSHYFHYIQLVKAGGGTSAAKFNLSDVGSSLIILPPLKIQKAIADHINQKCAAIDYLINGKTNVVNKLVDYKKSLIYEAVTGKMEV